MLRNAFNSLTSIHGMKATIKRINSDGSITTDAIIVKSNFFAFLQGPSAVTISKHEFVIPIDSIKTKFDPVIKKGDKIINDVYGHNTVNEIVEMPDIGGAIMGYRVRCE